MKSTAKRFAILAAMVIVAGLLQMAVAQGMGGQGRLSPKERAEALAKQLSLDSTTTAKLVAVTEKYQKIMADKRTELQGGDMDAIRAAMTEIRDKQTKEITALLTKEQAKKYEEILKEQMQRMQNRPPRNN